ncbi:molybdenum cofactor guanylyltransferase [Serratia fonticola]|jgi:molybdopterin-guanine dinucleotide biosynthesis protein A|uniref:Molybdenum cofactor guanylyltransferase n=1 Tax=Serratia fonticola TaxID=47917 RepID=A0A542BHF7_SERFO|nr:molybdenum cofactor guanylyltransferase MobA [Serratia fonticola]TQI78014.1 molybdenum cofactor guanylyltransferase [Serratia fonticola]TQI94989.1 molybdenum cofactor guanylyltransferase [Serratia fonticola]TVZ69487.1 molybdenum cofactor guanylyltransferase [Serratia fonticola]
MHAEITGVILAGGRSSRMGGKDKGLVQLGEKSLYQHVLSRLAPQVSQIIISANRNLSCYQESGLPVVTDLTADYSGPLAGILSGLTNAGTEWIVCAPCDVPNVPHNLVERLWLHKGDALAAYASDGEREHPTFALLHRSLTAELTRYLARGERKLMLFMAAVNAQQVVFSGQKEAFRNLNTPEDCQQWLQEREKHQ